VTWAAQCPIAVLGAYRPVSVQQPPRGDGLSRQLLFSFAPHAPSEGSQADHGGGAAVAPGRLNLLWCLSGCMGCQSCLAC